MQRYADERDFLIELARRHRAASDMRQVMEITAKALGERLVVQRVGFFVVRDDSALDFTTGASWVAEGIAPLDGIVPGSAFGDVLNRAVRDGRTIVFADSRLDPDYAGTIFPEMGVVASIGVPLSRGGIFEAGLYVHAGEARIWTQDQISLVETVAEFSWDAVKRLQAVADLIAANAALEDSIQARDAIESQLRQSQKMEAVGQLTGGIAHDFNNLITGLLGNLEFLQKRVAAGRIDDLGRFLLAARGAGERAASLTQRLLAFSRRQTLDPKPTDINRLIAGMEELLRRTVGPANRIEIVGAAGLWPASIDAGQLESALLNLCINGRDAMPDGGRLTIETANKWIDDRTGRERGLAPGQYLSVCVTDTGTGMSADTIEHAFEPFFTTKPIGQGTGLGLSMVYGFARQSGGQVRLYSELGQGTTVCLYLPRHLGADDRPEEEIVVPPAGPAHGETILVIEDEATIRHVIDEELQDAGYTVIGAADGAAGLKVLQSGARIELLITDVGLPNGLNGRQVADAGRALRPALKVLFITGYAENAVLANGHLQPGMALLTKPFSMDALAAKVAEMMTPAAG
ncbi:ATP-binding protein [Sphingomonas sp. BIUV-7]|uniref:histidine kinase n=1 Tax=Sphingomonas natans TaxID=3063330 RepID=A0ABT8YBH5_9SPHN|nr:ATP-binding protein [Sphingomonas sp. BIUV-7]MDO6415684.1 ATP-binding protein [Sphingomonas sp. BIUV-7]